MVDDIIVGIPLSALNNLLKIADEYPRLAAEVSSLRRRVEGLHGLYSECISFVGDIADEVRRIGGRI